MPITNKQKTTSGLHQTQQSAPASQTGQIGKAARRIFGQDPDPSFTAAVQTTKQAPGLMFFLGGAGISMWTLAVLCQILTTMAALIKEVVTSDVYKKIPPGQQGWTLAIVVLASFALALIIETVVVFAAIRVDIAWKKGWRESSKSFKAAAVEVAHQPTLLFFIAIIFFVANCLGDYGFVYSFTDSWYFLFFWGLGLTVGATMLLPESAQYWWSGMTAKAEFMAKQGQGQAKNA